MDAPGSYTLAALGITAALSAQVQTPIAGLEGMASVTIEAAFAYGSGGTSCSAVVQESMDGGTLWRDIARFDFTTSSDVRYSTLSAVAKSNVAYAALASAGVNDGLLGTQLRAVVTSVGAYVNTTLAVRASVR